MIDLRRCQPGDKLIRRDGEIGEYDKTHTVDTKWPHLVKHYNHTTNTSWYYSYTDNGSFYDEHKTHEYDIVEAISRSREPQGRWINAWGRKVWQAGWERWYAVDLSGDIYAYFQKPKLSDNYWTVPAAERSEQVLEYISEVPGDVDWRTSITPAADMMDWIEQETHEVNGFVVPMPVTEPLEKGQEYWLEMPTTTGWCVYAQWRESEYDQMWLERRLVHLTREAAIANVKAGCGIDPSL